MKTTVLIATYHRNSLLLHNLKSLLRYSHPKTEICILDDSFAGDSECKKITTALKCRYFHTGKSKGHDMWRVPGLAFNQGAKIARGEVLVLSCAEVYHPRDTLNSMLSVVENDSIVIPKCIRDDKGGILAQLEEGSEPSMSSIARLRSLDSTLPFFMGVSKQRFINIGGYDEDFTGVCWDDNDLTERLILSGAHYVPLEEEVVHLFHPRHNYKSEAIMKRWDHNKALYDARRGQIVRNKGRKWGLME